ncbi:MAG TPA: hypothetical protein VKU41_02760 [Polyangiaceae bacterium]|nr:hypothetical protein [Polyangiaceae bacterium]
MDHRDALRAIVLWLVAGVVAGCGSPGSLDVGADDGGRTAVNDAAASGSSTGGCMSFGGCGASTEGGITAGPPTCQAGVGKQCVCAGCAPGSCTTISGTVYDPAGNNPLYGITVFVASSPGSLKPMPQGAACFGCADLFPTDLLADAVTDAKGHFTIPNAPASDTPVALVVQVGKWRKLYTLPKVASCVDNAVPFKLTLPSKNSATDPTVGSIPNIAIATGGADSLECLLKRIGVDDSEYTSDPAGMSPPGQIKIFSGYQGASTSMPDAYPSQQLWDSKADLMRYDIVLLSCEGRDTVDGPTNAATDLTDSDRQNLLDYANAGGKVFASHYHYAWFNQGPFTSATNPPMATWLTGANLIDDARSFPGAIVTQLPNGMRFQQGIDMQSWLSNVGALQGGKLPIDYTRHNVSTLNSPPAQAWITLDPSTPVPNTTQYFSIDAPFTGAAMQGEAACGRVVYSDLHVSGGPGMTEPGSNVAPDYAGAVGGGAGTVPSGCASHPLTPQEAALEFMIFNLSSCVVPPTGVYTPPSIH